MARHTSDESSSARTERYEIREVPESELRQTYSSNPRRSKRSTRRTPGRDHGRSSHVIDPARERSYARPDRPSSRHASGVTNGGAENCATNALNDFYGGTASRTRRNQSGGLYEESRFPRRQSAYEYISRPSRRAQYNRMSRLEADIADIEDKDRDYHDSPPDGVYSEDWRFAAKYADTEKGVLEIKPSLVITRRGHRYQSRSFKYEEGMWNDEHLADEIKERYANMKWQKVDLLQKVLAYKTVAYVYVLQSRCRVDNDKWEITSHKAITTKDDKEGRDTFMYLLRYPMVGRREWTTQIDDLVRPGAIIYLEIVETFDAMKIYLGLILAILLSLGVGLAYGFAMDNDFGTGFSIASWMITALGFFFAVVAVGEFFGMEKATSFQTGAGLEEKAEVRDLTYDGH